MKRFFGPNPKKKSKKNKVDEEIFGGVESKKKNSLKKKLYSIWFL